MLPTISRVTQAKVAQVGPVRLVGLVGLVGKEEMEVASVVVVHLDLPALLEGAVRSEFAEKMPRQGR
jgi:hypothetical protein